MRVCDMCGHFGTLYRLYEETNYDEEHESGDLTNIGEFCQDCIDHIYGYIGCVRTQLMEDLENRKKNKSKVENINQIKMPEVLADISEELKAEMEKGFF